MRKMKDSGNMWIGAVPETWKMIPLKHLVSYNDEVLSENTDDEFEFDYIEIGSVQYGRGIICTEHIKFKNAPSRARRIVRKDDIIVSTVRTYLKTVATIPACNNSLIASTGFIVIRPHKILPRFMNYALLSESFISLVESHSTGISYPAINSVDVVKFKIPVPCRSEQERIATFLDSECAEIDAVLEKTRASIEEYKKLKQAVITQAVTKGIRGDRPMKNSGIEWIGAIPAEWNKDKVIRVFSVIGSGTTPKSSDENLFDGNTPWIQSGDINGENLFVTKNCVSNSAIESYSALRVYQAPYLVVAMYGASVGNLSLSMIDACVNQACCVLKKPTINLEFSFYIFKAVKDYLARKAVGGGQPNISQETIKQLWLPIPSADEQIEISNYLDEKCRSVDALIAKKQQYLTEIENYKKSLIYEYVTGKKEVV